ncbi:glycosyltransferase family 2 protein [Pedobacter psychrodurus]|uniref:glycosyltransferase family 2 protein n=1 Tax=Pedobacter psychrodurus TaxID=2530456 RepID=UPI00292DF2AE|nr:glycosyltransferase family 2 protein [Pedobacter psychrodurus]
MKISIIVPCFNCEDFVGRAIESVIRQSFTDWELLLIDNNSIDKTLAVIRSYQRLHPDKIKVYQERKKGAPAARNKGLREATGEWIQFLDADDEILPEKLLAQVKIIDAQMADLVFGSYIQVKELPKTSLSVYNKLRFKLLNRNMTPQDGTLQQVKFPNHNDLWYGLISTELGITSANLWRKKTLTDAGGWNENLTSSQEYDLIFRLLKNGCTVAYDLIPNTKIHQIENSISRGADKDKIARIMGNWLTLRCKVKEYLIEANEYNESRRKYLDLIIYKVLMDHKSKIPKEVDAWFNKVNIKVDFTQRFKMNVKFLAKRLEGFIKK